MKNFKNYASEKYSKPEYKEVEDGIYLTKDPSGIVKGDFYVTSLSFEMEQDSYGEENGSPQYMPQVPIEGLLDEFYVAVTDFYEELNKNSEKVCYQEFGSSDLSSVRKLRTLIGKRFYAKPYVDEEDGEEYYEMVLE